MSRFTVYGIPGSPYVRTILLALEEKGADYRLSAMGFGDHKSPDYMAGFHPFGRIPTMDDGDFRLYETHAMLRYIDRELPDPALVPADSRAQARMDQIISITDSYVRTDVSGAISFPRVVAPKLGIQVDEDAVAKALPTADACLAALSDLLGEQSYMAGDALSLADLMLVSHLAFVPQCAEGAALLERHPNLGRWLARMAARPSMKATEWERLLEVSGQKLAA